MSLWTFIKHRLPLYSRNDVDAQWEIGRLYGRAELGLDRDTKGRFVSIKPKTNYGVIHGADEDFRSIAFVETPDGRSSSNPD